MARIHRVQGWPGRLAGLLAAVAAVAILLLVASAVRLLPQLRNPFGETTTVRNGPVLLKSITQLSRYEAASGSFQVVVDLTKHASLMPSFIEGSQTLFIGQGTDIAFAGNPNNQQQVYILAQQQIGAAARRSQLRAEAQKNTRNMLDGMLRSLGFRQITVTFEPAAAVAGRPIQASCPLGSGRCTGGRGHPG